MIKAYFIVLFCLSFAQKAFSSGTCTQADSSKLDCGYVGSTQASCESDGCCWSESSVSGIPWCFYSIPGYTGTLSSTTTGMSGTLSLIGSGTAKYGADLTALKTQIFYETSDRVHVKLTDVSSSRWEVPNDIIDRPTITTAATDLNYKVTYTETPFGFAVTRLDDEVVVFNTSGFSVYYEDQYIELTGVVPTGTVMYGLGEHTESTGVLQAGTTYTLWARDNAAANFNTNLYGSHPMFVGMYEGSAFGVFMMNSNGMDIYVGSESVTYKMIGGVIDLYVFTGPTPEDVVAQYTELVGRPTLMPYWSLGFHNCRYGYTSIYEVEEVAANYTAANIPIDTYWTDIDYMDAYMDFTTDPVNYPTSEMKSFVDGLHDKDQHFVLIIDPGIYVDTSYSSYIEGVAGDYFIKDVSGSYYMGQVWPGPTYFPDFLNPNINTYWTEQINGFYEDVPVDGLWIDMNEVSNFCNSDGSGQHCYNPGGCPTSAQTTCCLVCETVDSSNTYDFPPYAINNDNYYNAIGTKTIAPSAYHYGDVLEYNVHNMYGLTEAIATNQALATVRGKRPFVLSRSSFPSSGSHTAHWTGDNAATWQDLQASIVTLTTMSLFGIPMVGADICGFLDDTTEELCNRWIELGAFYPFSRDHNTLGATPQELYRWDSVTKSAQNALGLRYAILPYLYTLLYLSHAEGLMVARALWVNFPSDKATLTISTQFMLGPGLLISPVLTQGATTVSAYFPQGVYYNMFDHSMIDCSTAGCTKTLTSDINTIQVHVLGGVIIPMQTTGLTTAAVRASPFSLLVALNSDGEASGSLFLDDGEQIDVDSSSALNTYMEFEATSNELYSSVLIADYESGSGAYLESFVILGVDEPSKVSVNGDAVTDFTYSSSLKELTISGLKLNINDKFTVIWA